MAEDSRQPRPILGEEVYVLYLDVMGFASRVASEQVGAYDMLKRVKASLEQTAWHRHPHYGDKGVSVQGFTLVNAPAMFSDSIFVCSRNATEEALNQLCQYANLCVRFLLDERAVAKGAIARGSVHWDPINGIHLGTGINRAYLLAESLNTLGIAIHPAIPKTRCMEGPVAFEIKEASPVAMHVPIAVEGFGVTVVRTNVAFREVYEDARERLGINVFAKYEASQAIMQLMLAIPKPEPVDASRFF